MTQADPEADFYVLWWRKTERIGQVHKAWESGRGFAWEARHSAVEGEFSGRSVVQGATRGGYPSRFKAVHALAAEATRRRRQATPHKDEPVAGLPAGWRLTQSKADADDGLWRVITPGGEVAGTLTRTSYRGRREWEARTGDAEFGPRVLPEVAIRYRGADGECWKSRASAARAVAAYTDPELDLYGLDI